MSQLNIGDKAPEFRLPADNGQEISTTGLKGRMSILYFYPKDNTPGCTAQACGFRDNLDDFNQLKANIVGISKDSIKKHEMIIESTNVNLISDIEILYCIFFL